LVAQRVYGLALGYEDLNDHESCGTIPCWRAGREGAPVTSFSRKEHLKPTELTKRQLVGRSVTKDRAGSRSRRSPAGGGLPRSLPERRKNHLGPGCHDDPLHGNRKGASSMATMKLLLPTVYIFCGEFCCVRLRSSNIDAAAEAWRVTAHRGTDSFRVAQVRMMCAGLRILPRGADACVKRTA